MTMIVILACLGIIIVVLGYDIYRSNHKSQTLSRDLANTRQEMDSMKDHEQALQSEVDDLQRKLQDAYTDSVTGLSAWPVFEEKVNQSIKSSERHKFVMGLMIVDIDEFSVINDALNNDAGNESLAEVAKRLQTCLRQVDSLGRFAKDTFVLLLNQLAKPEMAAIIAQRVHSAFAEPIYIDDQEIYVTVCVGIALYPSDGLTHEELLRNADQALHLAKEKGKQTTQFYEERLHHHSQRELTLHNSLSRENIYDEFLLYFQPILNERDASIASMEAILYWRHPELGIINAQELFEYAEKQKKLNAFSEWLLRSACRQFLSWRSIGFTPKLLGLPLSVKQLENVQFIYNLSRIMQELNFDPTWLLIEIKEDFSRVSYEVLEKAFNMLAYLGVKIALVDFGGGGLSLRYLKSFQFAYLKLENSFADDLLMNRRTQSLLQSIQILAEGMAAEVVVPGVESKEQLNKLKSLGIIHVQGAYIGEAVLGRDVVKTLTPDLP